jgi:hypothetical protein
MLIRNGLDQQCQVQKQAFLEQTMIPDLCHTPEGTVVVAEPSADIRVEGR